MHELPKSRIQGQVERNNGLTRQATIIGFSQTDAEPYCLLLDVLGWEVSMLSEFSSLGGIRTQLAFLDARQMMEVSIAQAIAVKPGNSLLAIIVDAVPPSLTAVDGRIEWLTSPFDIIAIERIIENAS